MRELTGSSAADLKSRDCAKAQTAARRLGEIGDRRAIGPLRDVASRRPKDGSMALYLE